MAKPQPPPKPATAPLSLKPEAAPDVTVAFGRTESGRFATAILKTQGTAILSCELVCSPTPEPAAAESYWRETAYRVLRLKESVPTVPGPPLVEAHALGLRVLPGTGTSAFLLVLEGGKVLPWSEPEKVGGHRVWPTGGAIFTGTKQDAWEELDAYACRHVLTESYAERRRKQAGG